MELHIKGKTVLVTASSAGIGKATSELFISEGCRVAISSSKRENLVKAVDEIKAIYGIEPLWEQCDINNPNEIEDLVKHVEHNLGTVDILVNNCGGPTPGFFEDLADENWEDAFEQVLMSAVRFTRLVLPGMKEKNWGRIINITSLSVKQPVDNLILSNSLRSGVTAFAKTLSAQVGKHNITVNNVAPGYTLTGRLYELAVVRAKQRGVSHEEVLASMAAEVPMKRLARPDEIASMIVYLSSEQAGYITGQTIVVDGGAIRSTY
ncbi:MAG: 3-oxoacyl-ACP reductase [Stygiobacter sp. RIFOXYC12_FULL_38_8]|nr:MAG: 3-oxoacyl-ACP reductase [Stygiobacter sp. GWC2_38_9]OGU85620.1 MAG: 3-oxoacyl-ACP reductase [Stygiobacter sp. RIFOXYA12_FULL_38_9]OGV06238.1 MAG: 3-oxoacyl-ACP reductase [Stygiobacter sp. RIFOXYB2_FULL_37_11]OGV14339.1 MAG: 3-oxoacyl-ACP reductase [Stygiobacter sp. RIFOXYA2_FULL_38_8]OGV15989.1 MAG: 3-oxoacyl-ACP reductase [Stygiobacter sp. RIFOXYC2_FULL_38_25]OGV23815.1 MAG: 3-oxoacyl-ACP reductase [Stygiobacter sp. RIFOXYC12_FULL_38_8]OGV80466.1 MAG: 3-oxoacyl-ACP reductase [Stygiob